MDRPPKITNEEEWLANCQKIVRVATGILDGSLDIISAARFLSRIKYTVCAEDDPDFNTFSALDSETLKFPLEEVRLHWSAESLTRYDAERLIEEERWKPRAYESARKLVAKYTDNV